jgi:hypothetical protein
LVLMGRDGSLMLAHTGDERVGATGDGVRSGTVLNGGVDHASIMTRGCDSHTGGVCGTGLGLTLNV